MNAKAPQNINADTNKNPNDCLVVSWAANCEAEARAFAQKYSLPIINQFSAMRASRFPFRFELSEKGWQLFDAAFDAPFQLRFSPKYQAQGKDPLLKAMTKFSSVLDVTAGWGADAAYLAQAGSSVVALERNPVVFTLLQQAHEMLEDEKLKQGLRFMHLDAAQASLHTALLAALGKQQAFDAVYLDPMFLGKETKRAKSKKPMHLMQRLSGQASPMLNEVNEAALFANAMLIAKKRVVVKRALKAPYLAGKVPQGSIKSKLLRFDIYAP